MFKSKVTKQNVVNADGATVVANRINQDCSVEGNISSHTDIRIDGTISGNITSTSKIVIGATGKVNGDIACEDLTVEGAVEGNISVSGTLYLRKTSEIGPFSVKFQKIIIEEGATVQCQLMPVYTAPKTDEESNEINSAESNESGQ